MRSVFLLALTLLLLHLFMPTLGAALESTLLAFLNAANTVISGAGSVQL